MPEKEIVKLAVDSNFIETIISAWPLVASAFGGAYAAFRLLRRLVREDVKTVRKEVGEVVEKIETIQSDIEECEDDHVYKDEFKQVVSLVRELHAHVLGNTTHNKRSSD